MSVGKRLRFEILKRDGFRCRYCGVTAMATALEVDHVVPRAEGGTDDQANLVTACFDCNRGKSDVPISESRLDEPSPIEAALEHAEQIRAYLQAHQIAEAEKNRIVDYLAERWEEFTFDRPMVRFASRFRSMAERYHLDDIIDSMAAVGDSGIEGSSDYDEERRIRYFYGALKRRAARRNGGIA